MSEYLSYTFCDDETFINTFDELPLWSAAFGMLLLKHLRLMPGIKVIDVGSGAGFPLMELASRMGESCKLYGIDPWVNANNRAKQKLKITGSKMLRSSKVRRSKSLLKIIRLISSFPISGSTILKNPSLFLRNVTEC